MTTVPAATPTVAAIRARGTPMPRRPATCPAMRIITVTQATAPGSPARRNSTSRIAPTAINCSPARAAAMTISRVEP